MIALRKFERNLKMFGNSEQQVNNQIIADGKGNLTMADNIYNSIISEKKDNGSSLMNLIFGNALLKVILIVVSTSIITLLVSGYLVYDRLFASTDLLKKIDALQLANEVLIKKHENYIADLVRKHEKDLQLANEVLIKKHENYIADLVKKFTEEKIKVKLMAKAKAKIQRGVTAIPIVGLASVAVFEKMEFDDWKKDHPDGTFEKYVHEISEKSQELLQGEYRDFEKYAGQIFETSKEFVSKIWRPAYR